MSIIVEGTASLKASASKNLVGPPMNALKKLGQYLKNLSPPIVDDGATTDISIAAEVCRNWNVTVFPILQHSLRIFENMTEFIEFS